MESTYDEPISLEKELFMKYEAVKSLEKVGYNTKKDGEDILIFAGEENIGKLTYSEEENVPIAVVGNRGSAINLTQKIERKHCKNILLDLGWAVSNSNKLS